MVPPVAELMVRVTCWTKEGDIVVFALSTMEVEVLDGEAMLLEPDQPLVRQPELAVSVIGTDVPTS